MPGGVHSLNLAPLFLSNMKELIALVAAVLSLLVAYQMHRDRLNAAREAAESAAEVIRKPLSQYIEPYRKELFAKLDDRRPADLVPPLETLKQNVLAKRQFAEPSTRAICDAGLVALDKMIAAAQHRTQALQVLVQLGARPVSSLEREDSPHTSSAFFKESAIRKAEVGKAQRQAAVEEAIAKLQDIEAQVAATHGAEAAMEDYGQRRIPIPFVKAQGTAPANPLQRAGYDQRQAITPRRDRLEQGLGY